MPRRGRRRPQLVGRGTNYVTVPSTLVQRARVACAHLPEAHDEQAFAEVRWRIRGRALVSVFTIERDDGPDTPVTFHAG